MTELAWSLVCSGCDGAADPNDLSTVCPRCRAPWLVSYRAVPLPKAKAALADRPWSMWRYREWLPVAAGEDPVSLGEGGTPLVRASALGAELDMPELWIKDESTNPTGSFKARGMSAAVTRARGAGASAFTVPTAGNAGVALSAYASRAGLAARVYAPRSTPLRILEQIRTFGAELELVDGHIGDCGAAARAYAAATGAFDVSTLREPYRIEGKKTMGLELAEQFGWTLPDAVLYPTGGGTGLIGMWVAFRDLLRSGWATGRAPRLYSVQAAGCAPVVRAFEAGATRTTAWNDPHTIAWGLRVPGPLGGPLVLRALRETDGAAVAVTDEALTAAAQRMARHESIDACPEGGATLAGLELLLARGTIDRAERVVLYNTGAGWLYRS